MVNFTNAFINGYGARSTAYSLNIYIREFFHLAEPFEHHGLLGLHADGVNVTCGDGNIVQSGITGSDLFCLGVITHHTKDLLSVGADGRLGCLDGILRHKDGAVYPGHRKVFGVGRC